MADTLNPPSIRSPMVDNAGRPTAVWSSWFLILYRRIGETLGRSTTAIDADVSSLSGGATTLESRMTTAEGNISALQAGPVAPSYTVAGVPAAAGHAGKTILVTDESGGAVLAFSDGTTWRRVTDRAVIS